MSLKGDKYENAEEIRFRLEHTVVLYDGKPVYIVGVNPAGVEDKDEIARVHYSPIPYDERNKTVRKYLSSRKFDLTPFKMGYMNYEGEALFVTRTPARQNRQGLSSNSTVIRDVRGKGATDCNFVRMIQSQGFADMVAGVYPSFKDAGEMLLDNETSSVAISRSFAFVIDNDLDSLLLMHKGHKCGIAMAGDNAIRLPKKFHFLREEMEQCRIPIA